MLVIDYTPEGIFSLYIKYQRRPDGRNRNPSGGRDVDACGILALEQGYRSQRLDGLVLDFLANLHTAGKIEATRNQLIAFGTGFSNGYLFATKQALYQQNLSRAMQGEVEVEYLHGRAVAEYLLTVRW